MSHKLKVIRLHQVLFFLITENFLEKMDYGIISLFYEVLLRLPVRWVIMKKEVRTIGFKSRKKKLFLGQSAKSSWQKQRSLFDHIDRSKQRKNYSSARNETSFERIGCGFISTFHLTMKRRKIYTKKFYAYCPRLRGIGVGWYGEKSRLYATRNEISFARHSSE